MPDSVAFLRCATRRVVAANVSYTGESRAIGASRSPASWTSYRHRWPTKRRPRPVVWSIALARGWPTPTEGRWVRAHPCRLGSLSLALLCSGLVLAAAARAADAQRRLLIKGATVVTMDAKHHVIPRGRVLIEGNRIAAVWQGRRRPPGVRLQGARRIKRGSRSLLFPGLINLHDHPNFGVLPPVPPPSSHALHAVGKLGTDPYDQRYEWNGAGGTGPDEFVRLIENPQSEVGDLGLAGEGVKYAEVGAMLGGETAIQGGAADPESDQVLVRNVDHGS